MSLPPGCFDVVYAEGPDPWWFADRWYEQRKRPVLLASLPRRQFRDPVEPGCGTGELTALLAPPRAGLAAGRGRRRPPGRRRRGRHGWVHLSGHVEDDFALDVHGAPGMVSVARAEGLL